MLKSKLKTSELQTAVKVVQKALTSRASLPILSSIKISAKDNRCQLAATDLYLGIELWLEAEGVKAGTAVVPGKQFREFVNSLTEAEVSLEVEDDSLVVKHGLSKANFSLYSQEEYPDFPQIDGDSFDLPLSLLEEMAASAFFAASNDQTRPVLTGVLLKPIESGLEVVATDGFRLAKLNLSLDSNWPRGLDQLLIPAASLKEVIAVAQEQKVERVKLTISTANSQIRFDLGDVSIYVRLLDGEFPPYEKIIPSSFLTQASLDRELLLDHVKRALIFCQDQSNIVKLKLSDHLEIEAVSTTSGKYQGKMEVNSLSGGGGEIAFNGRYLLDFLNSRDEVSCIFEMTESLKPAVWRFQEKKNYIYVVMPFRVNQ